MLPGVFARYFVTFLFLSACRSQDITGGAPPPPSASAASSTTIVVSEPLDAAVPDCTVHLVSDAFVPTHASPAGKVRVEGDYTRTLAKVSVDRPGAQGWSGTFNGPRDAFFDFLKRHVCTADHVYVLKPEGNKDPSKGPVTLSVFEMKPDEKADVENVCNGFSRAPGSDAGEPDLRDRAVMQWVEDVITTTKWDGWRRSFARERADLFQSKKDPAELFHARAENLGAAAHAFGVSPCPAALEWKKR
jgi:hypothetical protein